MLRKTSQAAVVNEKERGELEDKEGIEKEYQKSFVDLANLPLDKITISSELEAKINKH